jgi:SAM-dependent methyltransferase
MSGEPSGGAPPQELYRDRARAESFGAEAERYDRVRPRYPPELYAELLAGGATQVLDVGCGTGIAALGFRARGASVLGVEADERMARVARGHGLEVEVAPFERWEPRGRSFQLLVAGQAWHWVDPLAGAHKAASVLEPGGRIGLFWNFGVPARALRERLADVYARREPRLQRDSVLLGARDERLENTGAALAATGRFTPAEELSWSWRRRYTTAEWLEQLLTHSDHHALAPERRAALLDELAAVLADSGGLEMTYQTRLVTARAEG